MNRTVSVLRVVRRLSLLLLLTCGFVVSQEIAQAQVSACEQCGINETYCLSLADGEYLYCTDLADNRYYGCLNAARDHQYGCKLDCIFEWWWDDWYLEICENNCDLLYENDVNICENNLFNGYDYCRVDRTLRQINCHADFDICFEYYHCK